MRIALLYTDRDSWALGMRSVSAVLKEAGHDTRLVFMGSDGEVYSSQTLKEAKELVEDSDIIGISCLSRGSDKARRVIEFLRPLGKPIVWGGLHASLNPEECVEWADIVCRGEGEGMMIELTERLAEGRDWRDMANVAYRDSGTVAMNPLRPLISDLDELPLYDFTCVDEFHLTDKGLAQVEHVSDVTPSHEVIFNGSRGCAFQCTYCCNAKLKQLYSGCGRYVRKMSVSKYIAHVRALRESFPRAKYAYLIDEDLLARSVDELREFAEEFPRQVGLPFDCCGSPPHISKEKMDLLVRAGLWRIRMGVESGSERTKRDVFRRYMSNEVVMRAARVVSRYPQVVPYYFLLIANPYELPEDLMQTARFLMDLPLGYYLLAFNLVFFPGSVLYDRAVRDGVIDGKQDSGYELDFRGGLQYKKHVWKEENLYLNSLLFLMEGKSTRHRLGGVPRSLLPVLLHPRVVNFSNRHPSITQCAIAVKMLALSLRGRVAKLLRAATGDPTSIYGLRGFLKNKLGRILSKSASAAKH